MSRGKNLQNTIAENVLNNSLTATVWIFESLINMGILTIEAFLDPSLYKDPPCFSFETAENIKQKRKVKHLKPSEIAIKQSLWRLRKAGFVEKGERGYFLTKKGKKLADYILARKKIITKKWDKKWRIVIFDIPEKDSKKRDWLRHELYVLNYKKLQESVFIGKYPLPPDLIKNIKHKKIGNFVNYILAEKIYQNIGEK